MRRQRIQAAPDGQGSDGMNQEAKEFFVVLGEEINELRQRRDRVSEMLKEPEQTKSLFGHVPYATKLDDLEAERITVESDRITVEDERITVESGRITDDRTHAAHCFRPLGVCLSGGGIRSAIFNLGLL